MLTKMSALDKSKTNVRRLNSELPMGLQVKLLPSGSAILVSSDEPQLLLSNIQLLSLSPGQVIELWAAKG